MRSVGARRCGERKIQERSMSQDYQLFAEIDDANDHDNAEVESVEEDDENNHHGSRGEMDQDDADVLAEDTDASEEADATTSADCAESPEVMRRQRCSRLTDIVPLKRTKYTDCHGSTQDERWTSESLATTTALSPKADENASQNASHESTVAPIIHKEGLTNSQESSSDSLPDLIIEVEKKYSHDEPEEVYDELEKSMTKLYRKYILKIDEDDTSSMGSLVQRYETEFHSDHSESFFERSNKEVERTASAIAANTTGGSLIEHIIDEWTVQSSPETNNLSKSLPPRKLSDVKCDDHDHSAEQRKDNNSLSDEEVQALSESFFERAIIEIERTASASAADTTGGSLIERIIDEWTVQSNPETNNLSKSLPQRTYSDVKCDGHDHSAEQRKDNNCLSDEEVQALSESFFERSIKEVERTASDRAADTTGRLLIQRITDEWTLQSSPEANHLSESLPPRTFADVRGDDHDHSAEQRKDNNSLSQEEVQAFLERVEEISYVDVSDNHDDSKTRDGGESNNYCSPEKDNPSSSRADAEINDDASDDANDQDDVESPEEEVRVLSDPIEEISDDSDVDDPDEVKAGKEEDSVNNGSPEEEIRALLYTIEEVSEEDDADDHDDANARQGEENNNGSREKEEQSLADIVHDVDTDDADDHVYARVREGEKRNITESPEKDPQTTSNRDAEVSDDNEEEEGEKSNQNGSLGEMDQDHGEKLVEITDMSEAEEAASINGSIQDERRASDSLAKTTDASKEADATTSTYVNTPEAMRRQRCSRLTDIIPIRRTTYRDTHDFTPPTPYSRTVPLETDDVTDPVEFTTDSEIVLFSPKIRHQGGLLSPNKGLEDIPLSPIQGRDDVPFSLIEGQQVLALSPVPEADENASSNTSHENTDVAPFRPIEGPPNSSKSPKGFLSEMITEVENKYPHDEPKEVYDKLEKSIFKLYKKYILKIDEDTISMDSVVQRYETEFNSDDNERIESLTNSHESSNELIPKLNTEVEKKYSHDEPQEVYDKLEKSLTKLYKKYILKINEDTYSMDSVVQRYETELNSDDNESYIERSIEKVERTISDISAKTTDASKEADATTSTDVSTPEAMKHQRCSRLTDIIPIRRSTYLHSHDFTPRTPDSRTVPLESVDVTDPVEFTTDSGVVSFSPNKGLKDIPLSTKQGRDDVPSSPSEGQQALLSQVSEKEENVCPSTSRGSTEVAHCIPIQSPANSHESPSEITEVEIKYPHDEPKEVYDRLEISMIKLYKKYILKIVENSISMDSVVQRYETEFNSDDDAQD